MLFLFLDGVLLMVDVLQPPNLQCSFLFSCMHLLQFYVRTFYAVAVLSLASILNHPNLSFRPTLNS